MHRGDRLEVYGLQSGRVGSVVLCDDGEAQPHSTIPAYWLQYTTKVRYLPGQERQARRDTLTPIWHARGTPEPRWVLAQKPNPKAAAYRAIITEWLRGQGRADWASGVRVRQVLLADVNGDGRQDLLLSFDQVDTEKRPDRSRKGPQAYLLLRYQPRGSPTPRLIVVTSRPSETLVVTGLCDLDRDGWAEILVADEGFDWLGTWLYHWTGQGFGGVRGNYWGERD